VACGGRTLRESARRGEGDGPDGQVPHGSESERGVAGLGWKRRWAGEGGGFWAGKKKGKGRRVGPPGLKWFRRKGKGFSFPENNSNTFI